MQVSFTKSYAGREICSAFDLCTRTLASLFRSVAFSARAYPSVGAFLNAPRVDAPGCLILDVRLPGMSGLDFQSRLTEVGIEFPSS